MNRAKDFLTLDMYYKAIEGSDSALWVMDVSDGICYLSNRYYTMLGYAPGEFEGTMDNLFKLLHPEDVEKSNAIFKELFEGKTESYRNEVRLKAKSGQYVDILTQGQLERNEAGTPTRFIGWNIDISPLKAAQRKLDEERAQNVAHARLAQLGLLSGGLAHEVNNPLTVIQIRSEMMLKALRQGNPIEQENILLNLERIQNAAKKISEIIHGLRTIASGGVEGNYEPVTLQQVIEEVLNLCKSQFENSGIKVHAELGERAIVSGNASLLGQVIINLINNASDALELSQEKDIWVRILNEQGYTKIFVEDNGPGIKAEDEDKIMLPFYTTKAPGKGTGLGLSISKSIIKSHNGEISYQRQNGRSQFVITLPTLSN